MSEKILKNDEEWQLQLSPDQFRICRQKGTEPAFSGTYWNSKENGIYSCVCCSNDLFDSSSKFDSGTGWPSFFKPINPEHVATKEDSSLFMKRTEVICNSIIVFSRNFWHPYPKNRVTRVTTNFIMTKFCF